MNSISQILNEPIMSQEGMVSNISFTDISNMTSDSPVVSFDKIIDEIKQIFEIDIKSLRTNFSVDSYEKSVREIRNNIVKLRKMYYTPAKDKNSENTEKNKPKNQNQNQNQNFTNTQTQTQTQIRTNVQTNNNVYSNIQNQNSNSNSHTNFISNTNTNTRGQSGINNGNYFLNQTINLSINDSTFSQIPYFKDIKNGKSVNIIYNLMMEIAYFLLCYEDIFINYHNKSAYITMKLFLQMATLHFIKNIYKSDFILGLINKSCNILCKYKEISDKDISIKKIGFRRKRIK